MSDYFAKIAFLKYLQTENGCQRTGKPCRESVKCGCMAEMEDYIQGEFLETPAALASEKLGGES